MVIEEQGSVFEEGKENESNENENPVVGDSVSGEDNVSDDVLDSKEMDWNAEVEKRGAENIFKELRKKRDNYREEKSKRESLEKQIEELKANLEKNKSQNNQPETPSDMIAVLEQNPATKERLDKLRETGVLSDDAIRAMFELLGMQARNTVAPFEESFAEQQLNNALSTLERDEKQKLFVVKFRDKIRDRMKQEGIAPKYWATEKAIKMIIGAMIMENPGIFAQNTEKRISKEGAVEPSRAPSVGGGAGYTSAELTEYANNRGIDLSDTGQRASAVAGLKAMKNAKKHFNDGE